MLQNSGAFLLALWLVWGGWLVWDGQKEGRRCPAGLLLWRFERKRIAVTFVAGVVSSFVLSGSGDTPIEAGVSAIFLVATLLAVGQGAILWRWALEGSKQTFREEAVLCEVRSGISSRGEWLWERYLVFGEVHAKLEEPGALTAGEAWEKAAVEVMYKREIRPGETALVYFEGRWQTTGKVERGAVSHVMRLGR